DMKLPKKKNPLYEARDAPMNPARPRHSILPISKFGLMQITRQRMKPEVDIKSDETCPTCQGSGKIASTLILEDDIKKNLDYLLTHGHKNLSIMVHPVMGAYLKRGFPSLRWKWSLKYRQNIKIKENNALPLVQYKFIDAEGEEIKL
ncbi:MAG TPA: ribonuclease E/G, partial [Phnomibacter sp.]|nr:ribonuclease E/G [Phnomibacter sp.]